MADTPGSYLISMTETVGVCTITKELEVNVTNSLSIENLESQCSDDKGYRISFDIVGGNPPFFVNGNLINNRSYTSPFIDYGESYSFSIEDINFCHLTIEGEADCPCAVSAGTMKKNLLTACDTQSVVALSDSNFVLAPGFVGKYILHDSSGTQLGKIYQISDSSIFVKTDSIKLGVRYYISYVVSNITNNIFNLTNNCLSVSAGQPVVFYQSPVIQINGDDTFCGNEARFNLSLDSVSSRLALEVISPFAALLDTTFNSPVLDVVLTSDFFEQHLVKIRAEKNGCIDQDTLTVRLNSYPIANITEIGCSPDAQQYTVRVELSGGQRPYYYNSIEISDSVFVSEPISSGSPFAFIFSDGNGCLSDSLIGIKNCDCLSSAGTLATNSIVACLYEPIAVFGNEDFNLDANDSLYFVLHDGTAGSIGNIIEYNRSGQFIFNDKIKADTQYYVARIVGNYTNGFIDNLDPCRNVSNGQPIRFKTIPEIPNLLQESFCVGDLALAFTKPIVQSYTINGWNAPNTILQLDSNSIQLNAPTGGVFNIGITVDDGLCTNEGNYTIEVNDIPLVGNIQYQCSDDNSTYTATLYNLFNQPLIVGNDTLKDSLTFVFPSGNQIQELVFYSLEGCSTTQAISYDCSCTSSNGNMISDTIKVCGQLTSNAATYLGDGIVVGDTSFYVLHTSSQPSLGIVLATSSSSSFVKPETAAFGQTYYISYINLRKTFLQDLSDPCLSIAKGQPIVFLKEPEINVEAVPDNCSLRASLTLESDGGNVNIAFLSGPVTSSYEWKNDSLLVSKPGLYEFEITAYISICNTSERLNISFTDRPKIVVEELKCIGEAYQIDLEIQEGTPPYYINNVLISGNNYRSVPIASDSLFTYVIRDANGCESEERQVTKNCNCINNAGSFVISDTLLCGNTSFKIPQPIQTQLEVGAGINYLLTYKINNQLVSNSIVKSDVIEYVDQWVDAEVYIRPIAGRLDTAGWVDTLDQCFTLGPPLKITWKSRPLLDSDDAVSSCNFSQLTLPILLSGEPPFSIVTTVNGREEVFSVLENETELDLSLLDITKETNLSLRSIKDRYCTNEVNRNIAISNAKDWQAKIEPVFNFEDSTAMLIDFEHNIPGSFSVWWQWTNGQNINNSEASILVNPADTGLVTIIITDNKGCSDTLTSELRYTKEIEESEVVFPNILIPNDPVQSEFRLVNVTNVLSIRLFEVYNRWGNKIYKISNIPPEALLWTATCMNEVCSEGVYVFVIQWQETNGSVITRVGDVTIVNK